MRIRDLEADLEHIRMVVPDVPGGIDWRRENRKVLRL